MLTWNQLISRESPMKTTFLLSVLLSAAAAGMLLWWDAVDGTRFDRAVEDVRKLSAADLQRQPVMDPWGNSYLWVEANSGDRSEAYPISRGPDGRSETLGHDSDDIVASKSRFEWLAHLHPTKWIWCLLLGSGGSSLSILAMRSARRQVDGPV
jgi:hypothetical protein